MTFIEVNPKIFQKDVEKKIKVLNDKINMLYEQVLNDIIAAGNRDRLFHKKLNLSREDALEILKNDHHPDDVICEYICVYTTNLQFEINKISELEKLSTVVKYCVNNENKHYLYVSKEELLTVLT